MSTISEPSRISKGGTITAQKVLKKILNDDTFRIPTKRPPAFLYY